MAFSTSVCCTTFLVTSNVFWKSYSIHCHVEVRYYIIQYFFVSKDISFNILLRFWQAPFSILMHLRILMLHFPSYEIFTFCTCLILVFLILTWHLVTILLLSIYSVFLQLIFSHFYYFSLLPTVEVGVFPLCLLSTL